MKVSVDPELCVATGSCVETCPELFELGDDGLAVAKVSDVPAELEAACRAAAADCPVEAIKIEE